MEDWQKNHIQANLGRLVEETRTPATFLSNLNVEFSTEEIDIIENKCKSGRQHDANLDLYNLARTRVRAYNVLTKAFVETNQSGPAKILIQGFLVHQPCNVFDACEIVVSIEKTLIKSIRTHFYNAILLCHVNYQGHVLLYGDIVMDFDENTKRSIEKSVSDQFLIDLINNKTPVLINQSVPKPLNYYIPRRLTTRFNLNPTLFQKVCNDVFVVKGIELHELSLLTRDQVADVSSSQTEDLTTRFIVLDYEDDYKKICEISQSPVHLLKFEFGKFSWIESYGSINSLQDYVQTVQDELNEEELLSKCLQSQNPVCISDTPGMGKTVLLSRLAERIQQSDRLILVRFIILREFVERFQNIKWHRIDSKALIHAIAETASDSEIGCKLTRKLLKSESKIVVLIFDGFDEVLTSQLEVAKQILVIASKMKSAMIYVSTRPHMQDELEKTLCVLGYNILPFGEEDQIQFLTKYWGKMCNDTQIMRLEEFACRCLNTLRKRMNDFERVITGIPLQCLMLAEVYEQQAINYCKPQARTLKFNWEVELSITSIFEMYKKLVNLRFSRLQTMETNGCWKPICRNLSGGNVKFFTQMHMFAALELLLPHSSSVFKRILVGKYKVETECRELCTVGILENKETKGLIPRFIHRTFAEYFLGLFVSQLLINYRTFDLFLRKRENFLKFLTDSILETSEFITNPLTFSEVGSCEHIPSAKFKNPVICYFIDSHLRHSSISTTTNRAWTSSVNTLYKILAASVIHDYPQIFAQAMKPTLHKQMVNQNIHLLRNLLFLAAKYSSIKLFSDIYQFVQASNHAVSFGLPSNKTDFRAFPIHTAVESGNYKIVDFLIKASNPRAINETKYLMHCCLSESSNNNKHIISKKVQLIGLLSSINDNLKNGQLPDGKTPLMQSNIHATLLIDLIKLGVDVNATWSQECVLHKLSSTNITPESYHAVTQLLFEHGFNRINKKDSRQITPLHIAVQNIDLLEKTIHLLHANGADFNAEDEVGDTILFHAISAKRSVQILRVLIECEANWKHWNFNDENVLHICLKHDHHEALEFFLSMPDFDKGLLTCSNKDGLSPLVFGLQYGKQFTSAGIRHLETVGFIITHELASEVLGALFCNKRIMAWEHDAEFVRVADYLIGLGGIIRCKGGRSPWELESIQRNLDHLADIINFDSKLVAELKRRNIDIAELLSDTDSNLALRALAEHKQHTFEKLCLSLISCNQINPFMKLKLCLASHMQESVKFLTPPRGLTEFIQSRDNNLALLQSLDFRLSIKRIQDTLDSDVIVIKEGERVGELVASTLIVFQIVIANKESVNELLSFETKVVILCSQVHEDLQEFPLFFDDFGKKDLSNQFKEEVISGKTTVIDDIFLKIIDKRCFHNPVIIKLGNDNKLGLNESEINFQPYENTFDFLSQFKIFNVDILDKYNLCNLRRIYECFIENFTQEFQRIFKTATQFSRIKEDSDSSLKFEKLSGKDNIKYHSQIARDQDNSFPYKYMMVSSVPKGASEMGLVIAFIETDTHSSLNENDKVTSDTLSDIVSKVRGYVNLESKASMILTSTYVDFPSTFIPITLSSYRFEPSIIFEILEQSIENNEGVFYPENCDLFNASDDRWIHACINGNHIRLLEMAISCRTTSVELDWEQFVVLAVALGGVPAIEFLIKKYVMQTKKDIKDVKLHAKFNIFGLTLLHLAVLRGSFSIFNYLIAEGFRNEIRKPNFRGILHDCLANTIDKPNQVNDRIKIIGCLLEIDNTLSEERNHYDRAPILAPKSHVDLVIHLVNLGVDVFASDKDSQNILHCCPDYWSPEEYDKFVHVIRDNGYTQLFHLTNMFGETALSRAVRNLDILDTTIELFASAKVDFNATTNYGNTVLSLAKKQNRSNRVIGGLIRYGAKKPPRV
ncbi:unnamed protein product [Orchesella dallaii]|uniref:NACHT domain-containing protein n=1 Tax=Orchesella dallaii TaxID=48710 RepID=A0ABP1S6L4_9HEXA